MTGSHTLAGSGSSSPGPNPAREAVVSLIGSYIPMRSEPYVEARSRAGESPFTNPRGPSFAQIDRATSAALLVAPPREESCMRTLGKKGEEDV